MLQPKFKLKHLIGKHSILVYKKMYYGLIIVHIYSYKFVSLYSYLSFIYILYSFNRNELCFGHFVS